MKILVANPPTYFREFPNRHFIQSGSRWSFSMDLPRGHDKEHYQPYPFNLGYITSWLSRNGLEVYSLDACAHDMTDDEFKNYVHRVDPDFLLIEVPTVSFPLVARVLDEIHEEDGDIRIMLMGAHVTARPEDAPKSVHTIIRGEYPKIDFDSLPNPDRDSFPIRMYHDFEFHKPTAQMLTSKGCPSSCSFCLQRHVIYASPKYWRRKAESVVDEVVTLVEEYGARQIYFDDDTMTIMPSHVESICHEFLRREVTVPWTCMGDATLSKGTLELMAKAGCIGIKFGVETVNPLALDEIGKSFLSISRVNQLVKDCKDLGIWSHATYIIGLPDDHRKDIEKTIDFARDLGSDSCQFSIATPFPGTPFFFALLVNGWLITHDWTRFDGARSSVVSYPWLSNVEIDELFQKAMDMRKKYNLSMRDKVK